MHSSKTSLVADYAALTDGELVVCVQQGYTEAFRHLVQRSNQRLFRIARGVINDDSEAEDVVQESYLHAFAKISTFRGESSVLTWMTRIVLNEAYRRLRDRRVTIDVEQLDISTAGSARVIQFPCRFGVENPADTAGRAQIRHLLEQAVGDLPKSFRLVFILRDIEECTTEETAETLGIRPETVKTRLHRARRLLRVALQDSMRASLSDTFPFLGARCARMTDMVMTKLATPATSVPTGSNPD